MWKTDSLVSRIIYVNVGYCIQSWVKRIVVFYCMQILVEWNVESKLTNTTGFREYNGRLRLSSFLRPTVGFPTVRTMAADCTILYHLPFRGFFLFFFFLHSASLLFSLVYVIVPRRQETRKAAGFLSMPLCPSSDSFLRWKMWLYYV